MSERERNDARAALVRYAVEVAAVVPVRESRYVGSAYVPWRIVNGIRVACAALGIDWRRVALETQAPASKSAMLELERGARRGLDGYAEALERARRARAEYLERVKR